MRLFCSPFLISLLFLSLAMKPGALAQKPTPSAKPPAAMPNNGGFERSFNVDNLWDGVDSSSQLSGFKGTGDILLESGNVGEYLMPVSVAVADMNNDKLPDLVTADPAGYIRIYFNQGSAKEAKFTNAELVSLWMPYSIDEKDKIDEAYKFRTPVKIAVSPMKNSTVNDLIIGNYLGELFIIPNTGTPTSPEFRQPNQLTDARIDTAAKGELWCNLLSPYAMDINNDGKTDILSGEGSYSANSIHLLLNEGSNAAPKFSEESRSVIAFGDGREQLTPTMADYNGDGNLDLIVGDRLGELSLYLNPGKSWKPGMDFPFTSTIKLGNGARIPGPIAPAAADLNGDGLFDLVIGKPNGRLAVAYNKGTPQEPKFDAPVDIAGVNVLPVQNKTPITWTLYSGYTRGNALCRVISVDETEDSNAKPTEGKFALKAFYLPNFNKVMKPYSMLLAGKQKGFKLMYNSNTSPLPNNKYFLFTNKSGMPFRTNTTYELSFNVKGNNVRDGQFLLGYRGYKKLGEDKIERGDRNTAEVKFNVAEEESLEPGTFSVSSDWKLITKTFRVSMRDRELKDLDRVTDSVIHILAELPDPSSTLYIDGLQIVEKQ